MCKWKGFVVGLALLGAPAFAAGSVQPQMQQLMDEFRTYNPKPFHTVTPMEARKAPTPKDAVESLAVKQGKEAKPVPLAMVEDRRIPGPVRPIDIRVYTPEGTGPFPAVVYFHGGGFVVADLDVYDAGPRALAKQTNAVVISSHYRQAPENPFPASHDDAVAAFKYVASHPEEFNIDAQNIAVAGESAGGNLATTVAMKQKETKRLMPVFQLLVYPFVSNDLSTPSHRKNGQGNYLIGNPDLEWFWKHELGPNWKQSKDPRALPIHATAAQLRGLPPAILLVGSLDPLLDEGLQYADNLKKAGVPVDVKLYDGVTHEFFGMAAVVDTAKQAQADAAAALRNAFAGGVGGSGERGGGK